MVVLAAEAMLAAGPAGESPSTSPIFPTVGSFPSRAEQGSNLGRSAPTIRFQWFSPVLNRLSQGGAVGGNIPPFGNSGNLGTALGAPKTAQTHYVAMPEGIMRPAHKGNYFLRALSFRPFQVMIALFFVSNSGTNTARATQGWCKLPAPTTPIGSPSLSRPPTASQTAGDS